MNGEMYGGELKWFGYYNGCNLERLGILGMAGIELVTA